ncbi:hypothetical protein H6783_01795 [Candidatus Nomurabacteria bacterium]|nr:hypothetical protein [Candidatus Nomurabacteria bacterium]
MSQDTHAYRLDLYSGDQKEIWTGRFDQSTIESCRQYHDVLAYYRGRSKPRGYFKKTTQLSIKSIGSVDVDVEPPDFKNASELWRRNDPEDAVDAHKAFDGHHKKKGSWF